MKKVGITVAAAVCVVLLCVGFYFMKNSDGSQASKENLTVVQRINEKIWQMIIQKPRAQ